MGDLFTPRAGTRVDYAVRTSADVRVPRVQVALQYTRVQPGFESLGVPYVRSDQESLRPRLTLASRFHLDATLATTRNNLRGDRLLTQTRREPGTTLQTTLGRLTLGGSVQALVATARPTTDSLAGIAPAREQQLWAYALTPSYSLHRGSTVHVLMGSVGV